MRVLAFIEAPDHVCARYRVRAFRSAVIERGWSLEVCPLSRSTLLRVAQLRSARAADLVVLQRRLLPIWQIHLLRKWARTLVYDFDDAVMYRDSYARKGHDSLKRTLAFWATGYAADLVLAGNRHLTQTATNMFGQERVRYMPTTVDPSNYTPANHARTGSAVRLAWIGQPSTLPGLRMAQPCWTELASELPDLELRLISSQSASIDGLRVCPRPWSSATEALELAATDIGVSWLPDDSWSRGKCGLKVLQYMAAGLPVVANSVGPHRELIIDGETGILADSPQAWSAAISRLAHDRSLRARMGLAGRARIRQHYNCRSWADQYCDYLAAAAGWPVEQIQADTSDDNCLVRVA